MKGSDSICNEAGSRSEANCWRAGAGGRHLVVAGNHELCSVTLHCIEGLLHRPACTPQHICYVEVDPTQDTRAKRNASPLPAQGTSCRLRLFWPRTCRSRHASALWCPKQASGSPSVRRAHAHGACRRRALIWRPCGSPLCAHAPGPGRSARARPDQAAAHARRSGDTGHITRAQLLIFMPRGKVVEDFRAL